MLSVILFAGNAAAGGIELNKDAVFVSPPDSQALVTIAGPPGCVFGVQPIYIMARNKESGAVVNATAHSNGGFSFRMQASGRDKIKLVFVSANGDDKNTTVRVPPGRQSHDRKTKPHERHEVSVDLGQFSQFGAPELVEVKPDGKGGTRVHVGARPTVTPTQAVTAIPSPTPSPQIEEDIPQSPPPTPTPPPHSAVSPLQL
jgi:hypothetical protein